ncbi:MAG: sigma-70 family RNA polymerase sigma factor [Acidobacteriota bacterium]
MADTTISFPVIRQQTLPPMERLALESVEAGSDSPLSAERELDLTLLSGLRAGEESAFEALVLRFEHTVYGIVSRMTDDPADAADVVQEVFLKVFRKIGGFRGESSLKTWIFRIAINEARNHRRWFGRHRAQDVGLEAEPGLTDDSAVRSDWLEDRGQSPFEITLDHEMHQMLEQALARLSSIHRAALVLRDIEGLSYEEIGEVLDVPPGTVRSRMVRARESLRKELLEIAKPSLSTDALQQPMQFRVGGSEAL